MTFMLMQAEKQPVAQVGWPPRHGPAGLGGVCLTVTDCSRPRALPPVPNSSSGRLANRSSPFPFLLALCTIALCVRRCHTSQRGAGRRKRTVERFPWPRQRAPAACPDPVPTHSLSSRKPDPQSRAGWRPKSPFSPSPQFLSSPAFPSSQTPLRSPLSPHRRSESKRIFRVNTPYSTILFPPTFNLTSCPQVLCS